jgi:hypothetical protein
LSQLDEDWLVPIAWASVPPFAILEDALRYLRWIDSELQQGTFSICDLPGVSTAVLDMVCKKPAVFSYLPMFLKTRDVCLAAVEREYMAYESVPDFRIDDEIVCTVWKFLQRVTSAGAWCTLDPLEWLVRHTKAHRYDADLVHSVVANMQDHVAHKMLLLPAEFWDLRRCQSVINNMQYRCVLPAQMRTNMVAYLTMANAKPALA